MGMSYLRRIVLICSCLCGAGWAVSSAFGGGGGSITPEAQAVLLRARSAIGPEAELEAVESLRFVGRMETFRDSSTREIEIILMKPGLVRTTITSPERTLILATDHYEGWRQLREGGRTRTQPMDVAQFWETRFGAIDNLYFFRAFEPVYGSVEAVGKEFFEGEATDVLLFRFNHANQYRRRFAESTGRMVTASRLGATAWTREEAIREFDGLQLPTVIENYEGEERVSRFVFTTIEVNPEVDPAVFRYPVE